VFQPLGAFSEARLFGKLPQLFLNLSRGILRLAHDGARLLSGRREQVFFFFGERRLTLPKCFQLLLHRQADRRRLVALRLCLLFILLDGAQHIFKGDIPMLQKLSRAIDDRVRQSQLAGNLKGVGFARYADKQAIGRAECFDVEFHGSVLHARRGKRVFFEFVVVSRCYRHRTLRR